MMYYQKLLLTIMNIFFIYSLSAQSYPVTEDAPANINGLMAGYKITGQSEKEVGDKGNFSRYNVRFYVTNTTGEAKILLLKDGFTLFGSDVSSTLVQFVCSNATGARLTSKGATIMAKPCNVLANVEDKECGTDKTKKNTRYVQIGYWIKPGETISASTILIVPLNEKPTITASLYNSSGMTGSAYSPYSQDQVMPAGKDYVRIRNFAARTYLNIQNGPLNSTSINENWISAQWQLTPVPGTNYYLIRNLWKNEVISTESPFLHSNNDQSANSMWILERVTGTNSYLIRNAGNGTYLNLESGNLKAGIIAPDQMSARWIFE